MPKNLVIVESPAKVKTISKILGRGYGVKACMGHVRDLPGSRFGIDIKDNFAPTYQTIKGKEKLVKELKKAAKEADSVFIATDPDREGEAIAWHLVEALNIPQEKARRVEFNEITKSAVMGAFERPRLIMGDLVNAQQARRFLDRIVGYKLSPLLWKKVARGLSAGRVQSVAVKIIVDREKEVLAFKTEEYWEVIARVTAGEDSAAFDTKLSKLDGKDAHIGNETDTKALVAELGAAAFAVAKFQRKEKLEPPQPPFTTSLMQQQAGTRLRFSAKKTMQIAQQLYEGVQLGEEGHVGLITYMRTDSFKVAEEAIAECRRFIPETLGKEYLSESPRRYHSRKGAQEAHEAIRPTSAFRAPDKIRDYLTGDQFKLYRIIYERFVATQMAPARYGVTEVEVAAGRAMFRASSKHMTFDGCRKMTGIPESDEQVIPELSQGQSMRLLGLKPSQHFTEPPPRYTEATLVKALEKFGIGRPSTYAPIISTIQDRGYVRQENRALSPTELGMLVTDKLVAHFGDIMDTGFTAKMEKQLDQIEDGKVDWHSTLRDFYGVFSADLTKATDEMTSARSETAPSEEVCEKCGKPMIVRWSKNGRFLSCSGYPECKTVKSLVKPEPTGQKCEKCGADMVIKSSRAGKKFLACSAYPNCKNTRSLAGGKAAPPPQPTNIACEKCGALMIIRYGRRGRFLACPGFPKCRNAKPLPQELRDASKKAEEPKEGPPDSPQASKPAEDN
jgi:DNA topoisomerase-1